MARTADTNRRKTASRRRVIQSIREKYEPKVARTANQKLKGSGVGIFSFSCGNFFIPELKRKSSRATFCGASKQKIVARKRFAGWLSFSVPFSLFGLNSAALSISRARTLYMQCVSFLWLHAVSHFFGLFCILFLFGAHPPFRISRSGGTVRPIDVG